MDSTELTSEPTPFSIVLSLPRELLTQELALWLRPVDLCHIGATCREMRWFLDDNVLWGRLVVSTFGSDWQSTHSPNNDN
jgi:hypothetical protein